jgi:hypothetical protein
MAQQEIRYRLAFLLDNGTIDYGNWVEDLELLFPWVADYSMPRWIEDQNGEYVAGYVGEIVWSNDLFPFEEEDEDDQVPVVEPAQASVEGGEQPEMVG